jgi:hypothetical protein
VGLILSPLSGKAQDVRSYDAPRATSTIQIDGRLDDAWSGAPWTEAFVDIRGEGWPVPAYATRAKMMWDDTYLYVGAMLEEPNLWGTLTQRDAIVYRDHDFEIFLDPDGDGEAYFEFEINSLGTEFDLFLDRRYNSGGRAFIEWDMPGVQSAVHLFGTLNDPNDVDGAWSVEVAIPWKDLVAPDSVVVSGQARAMPPREGESWRVNFSRVEWPLIESDDGYRKEREPVDWSDHPEDNWVWSPQGVINMYVPERWGIVRFVRGEGE